MDDSSQWNGDDIDSRVREALQRGDSRGALRIAMDAHGAAVYRFCISLTGDPEMADDVRQIVFLEAYRDLPRFEWRSKLLTWLLGIAGHRCKDALKKRGRWERRAEPLDTVADTPATRPDPAREVDRATRFEAIRHCLAELGHKAREAVVLRFQEELSYVEMAEILDARAPTLQARVARALPVLRRCLEGRGVEP